MRFDDFLFSIKEFWHEFRQVKLGTVGICLLAVYIAMVFIEPVIIPYKDANTKWRDINYWEDNAKNAPPVWIDLFSSKKHASNTHLKDYAFQQAYDGNMSVRHYTFSYNYTKDIPPTDLILRCDYTGSPIINMSIERPDSIRVDLIQSPLDGANSKSGVRISIDKDAKKKAYMLAIRYDNEVNNAGGQQMINPTAILFAKAQEGMYSAPVALRGVYKINADILAPNATDSISSISLTCIGSTSGLLGTDNSKRDLWSGIVSGVKWALLIGLLTAILSVSIGVVYGVMCAYLGGWRDSLMQRIFEIFVGIPLLPLIIVLSAVFKPSIFTLIIMMSCFFWVGPVKTVRSIGLQIKEEVYIEASRAAGASRRRIIFKHMVPLLIPYAFAAMSLSIPAAIVYESSVSLLGLGDSTIVTWGQILHDAFIGGAVINGIWWWVIPPGLAIAMMGMTFAFIGTAMDKILHPKLRTR
ncbi:MAG: ABC transporter permease [Chitinivibrionales bacterium]|nr:ABC transporter permease [Chitinivibrionales bacterium]